MGSAAGRLPRPRMDDRRDRARRVAPRRGARSADRGTKSWPRSRSHSALRMPRCTDGEAAGRVQSVRGDLRPRADDRQRRGHRNPRQSGRSAVARAHLPEGSRDGGHLHRSRPPQAPGEANWHGRRRALGGDLLGRGLRPRRRRHRAQCQRPRLGCAGCISRQPDRAQPRQPDAWHRDGQRPADAQPIQRHVGRPASAPSWSPICCTDTNC